MDGQDQMTLKPADLTIPPGLWTNMSVCLPCGEHLCFISVQVMRHWIDDILVVFGAWEGPMMEATVRNAEHQTGLNGWWSDATDPSHTSEIWMEPIFNYIVAWKAPPQNVHQDTVIHWVQHKYNTIIVCRQSCCKELINWDLQIGILTLMSTTASTAESRQDGIHIHGIDCSAATSSHIQRQHHWVSLLHGQHQRCRRQACWLCPWSWRALGQHTRHAFSHQ